MSNLQTITDGASESIEGLDGLLRGGERLGERTCEEERRWRCLGERRFGRPCADDQTGPVGASLTRMESSSPSTATSPNLRRGGFTDVHNASGEAVPTCTFVLADLTFWFDS